MKKLTMFFFVAIVCSTVAVAQDTSMVKNKMHHQSHMKMTKDCMMMEDGKMMMMKGGKTMAMDQDVNLTNGATVMTDGSVKMKDGTSKQLKNGDCMYMNGKMMTGMKKSTMHKKTTKSKMPM
jgi:hypothetical protein